MTFLYLCIMNRITPTYTKKELSLMYFPNDSYVNGWRKLKTILLTKLVYTPYSARAATPSIPTSSRSSFRR